MKKLVAKVDLHDDKARRKAMQVVSSFGGIESLNMDPKDNKITVSGDFDPIKVVKKLRKSWHTDIVSVGPAKEDGKKDEGKKDEGKKNENQVLNFINPYQAPYSPAVTYYYMPPEENQQCVIS